MRLLNVVQKNPAASLAVVTAGVLGWLSAGLAAPPPPAPPPPVDSATLPVAFASLDDVLPAGESRPLQVGVLPRLKPGMTRMQVEGVVGPPSADSLHPVTFAEGRLTYRTAYDLAEPDISTIRPIGPRRVLPRPPVPAKSLVAMEYDASKPGHPLVEVYFLDPLF